MGAVGKINNRKRTVKVGKGKLQLSNAGFDKEAGWARIVQNLNHPPKPKA